MGSLDAAVGIVDAAVGAADANGVSAPCERYLSCLLVTAPETYAAALALYGSASVCWATPQQTMNCSQACDSSFAKIASQCSCIGSICKGVPSLTEGDYLGTGPVVITDECKKATQLTGAVYALKNNVPRGMGYVNLEYTYYDPITMFPKGGGQVSGSFAAGKAHLKDLYDPPFNTIDAQLVSDDQFVANIMYNNRSPYCTTKLTLTLTKK